MDLKVKAGDFVGEKDVNELFAAYEIGEVMQQTQYTTLRALKKKDTGEPRTIKIVHKRCLKKLQEKAMYLNEFAFLRELDHPNLVNIFELYQDEQNYYVVMEALTGPSLFDEITAQHVTSETVAAEYMKEILSVIIYLHEQQMVHRDIKPENFFINQTALGKHLKAVSMCTADKQVPGALMKEQYGSPFYVAPEILKKRYTEACDIWSAGVSLYFMLSGTYPFTGNSDRQIFKEILRGEYTFPSPLWDNISLEAKDLIAKMLVLDFRIRITPQACLQHPWIQQAKRPEINLASAAACFDNLKTLRSEQCLQRATLAYISSQLTTDQEKAEMLHLFKSLDTDGNGSLSRDELIAGFVRVFGDQQVNVEEEVDKILAVADRSGSGALDYSEFLAVALDRKQVLSRERLTAAFKFFDVDGSGKVSGEELKTLLGRYHACSDAIWNQIVRQIDGNGDGEIDVEEFIQMMEAVLTTQARS